MLVSNQLPGCLAAPAPTWSLETDVVVLGSGAAGLSAALAARPTRDVLLITKDALDAGSTNWAQGGLAAVLDPRDDLEHHVRDTLQAGAGLCDELAVRDLVSEAPTAIRYLMSLGASFDRGNVEGVALTKEGGHSHRRIVHAGGDQSGAEVQRTLDESVRIAGVKVMEHVFGLDLIVGRSSNGERQVCGVKVALLDERGEVVSVGTITARAVVIGTGGFGQVYASTSNPPAVTGDGVAMALRAGSTICDLEFIQFHPTVLWLGANATGQQALISEAVRGEGAVLVDAVGERFMTGLHPQSDLAPRDIVAKAICEQMARAPGGVDDHVYLDASLVQNFATRFPSITHSCTEVGIDPACDLIPVAPAAHYACGGVVATLDGVTDLVGLFVVGEAACTGVHGANRLASNSLTESVVAGTRLGRNLAWTLPDRIDPDSDLGQPGLLDGAMRADIRSAMSRHVGVLRTSNGLRSASEILQALVLKQEPKAVANRSSFEATNMLAIAHGIVGAAQLRHESRGCHRRTDYAEPVENWRRRICIRQIHGILQFE